MTAAVWYPWRAMQTLPVVDLQAFSEGTAAERASVVQRFGDAFQRYGFATLSHHGIARARFDEAFSVISQFFALPEADKQRLVVPGSDNNRGYVAFGSERALGAKVGDLKEFFHIGQATIRPEHEGFYQPNVWPALPGFEETLTALYRDLEAVARVALRALAIYLDQPEETLSSMIEDGNSVLRPIHYPPLRSDHPSGAVRAAAHGDINLITLLAESTAGGLEILTREDEWMPVRFLGDQLVVNAGDMLALLAGGRIPATVHRVVNPSGANVARYSLPFFTHPRPEVMLSPLPGLPGSGRSAVRTHDFLTERLRAIADGAEGGRS